MTIVMVLKLSILGRVMLVGIVTVTLALVRRTMFLFQPGAPAIVVQLFAVEVLLEEYFVPFAIFLAPRNVSG